MDAGSNRTSRPVTTIRHISTLLEIPPFPGARVRRFERLGSTAASQPSLGKVVASLLEHSVGGTYWAKQPLLPERYLLVRSLAVAEAADVLEAGHGEPFLWISERTGRSPRDAVIGDCDPWHMLKGATGLVCGPDDPVRLIAAVMNLPIYLVNGGAPKRAGSAQALLADALPVNASFANPFGGAPMSLVDIIALSGFWRSLIDANRDIGRGLGFAFWKQSSVLPLLWNGGDPAAFFQESPTAQSRAGAVALWRSKASPEILSQLERRGTEIIEVEDGFMRSAGLGADCIPPQSITVDRLGPYFDPSQPSELEHMLEDSEFDPALLHRARAIRARIVAAGIGKYGRSISAIEPFDPVRRHILVAGQVENDRSVLTGGCGLTTNQELLERVRAAEPDAFLIYKPHPDVVAGHRKGVVGNEAVRRLADKVVTDQGISALIDMVDEVHVNTSLAGFEALMRHKSVTTYGVPFYAGWGLTRDLGPVPARRTRRRTLDELVAATLLLYPRYLDPETGLPCPAEVIVDHLTRASSGRVSPLVRLRRWQGRLRAYLAAWSRTPRR